MEIERKFLVKTLPNLESVDKIRIKQGYLSFDKEVRIRSVDDKDFYLTLKSDGDLIRDEVQSLIDRTSFQILKHLIKGRVIDKTRYYVSGLDNNLSEIDIYHDELEGLIVVENEFRTEDAARSFVVPDWYGREITYDKRYKNKNLARCSKSEIEELIK